jgi:hypothetical protein
MMCELARADELLAAVRAVRELGVTQLTTYTPYEVHGLEQALGERRSKLGLIVLAMAVCGGAAAYLLEWWINVVDYPLNIGGRPDHSAPAFVPICFEMAVLSAAVTAFVTALVLGGMPRLWDPVFEIDGFERATIDRFWLAIDAGAIGIDRGAVTAALEGAGAVRVLWPGGDS